VKLDLIWKKYMEAPDQDTFRRDKPIIESKVILVKIMEALEQDNLVMFQPEDGTIVLI
jgi:hypothetical protein